MTDVKSSSRIAAVLPRVVPVLTLLINSWPVSGQELKSNPGVAPSIEGTIAFHFNKMEIGEVVGVEYSDGRYLLWATPPKGEIHATIFRDSVIQLARASLAIPPESGWGFSLDFQRLGKRSFEARDVLAPEAFATILEADHPLSRSLRDLPEASGLAAALRAKSKGGNADKAALRKAADLLNRARELPAPWKLVPEASISAETQAAIAAASQSRDASLRAGRMVLEDALSPAVNRHVGKEYRINYKPAAHSEVAAKILSGSRTEAIFLRADAGLKSLGAGAVGELGIPSQMALCAEAARRTLERGDALFVGEYVDFFNLDVNYHSMSGDSVGVWLEDSRLRTSADAVTGTGTPACALRFASNLTAKMPSILQKQGELPQAFRDVKTLLMLMRAVTFLSNCAPLSPERLNQLSLDSEHLPNVPPKVLEVPILLASGDNAVMLRISGGVEVPGRIQPPRPEKLPVGRKKEARGTPLAPVPDSAAFVVTNETVEGRQLLRIDVTSMLDPR